MNDVWISPLDLHMHISYTCRKSNLKPPSSPPPVTSWSWLALNINKPCLSVPCFTWLLLTADAITTTPLPSLPAHQQRWLWNPRARARALPQLRAVPHRAPWHRWCCLPLVSVRSLCPEPRAAGRYWLRERGEQPTGRWVPAGGEEEEEEEEAVRMARNSSTQPRVTFQTPEKPGEESSHRKLGKLTIKYNRKDLQRWLDLEEWVDAQLQELYQYPVSSWGKSAPRSLDEWDKGSVCCHKASSALLETDPCLPSLSGILLPPATVLSLNGVPTVREACIDVFQLAISCLVLHLLGGWLLLSTSSKT